VVFFVLVGRKDLDQLGTPSDEILHLVAIDEAAHQAIVATPA
jgi:hypothetical protein